MNPTEYEVYLDEDSYSLVEYLVLKRGRSKLSEEDIEMFKNMSKDEINEYMMPRIVAETLLEENE